MSSTNEIPARRTSTKLLISFGKLEKEAKIDISKFFYEMSKDPEAFFKEIGKKAGKEGKDLFVNIFFKLTSLSQKLESATNLSADKKIEVGEELKKIADDFKKLDKMMKNGDTKHEL